MTKKSPMMAHIEANLRQGLTPAEAKMYAGIKGKDACTYCGSVELFDTETEPGYEGMMVTVCLTCGLVQIKKSRRS